MNSSAASPPRPWFRRSLLTFCQIAFFIVVWVAADFSGRALGVRIPGSVLGLAVVLSLLFFRILKPKHLQFGAEFLLTEMLLFFTPACVAAMKYFGLFVSQGLRLLAAVALGTLTVMAGTVWLVDKVFRWESKRSTQMPGEQ
jgi:holin-like protein